jgi:hypothetical protein
VSLLLLLYLRGRRQSQDRHDVSGSELIALLVDQKKSPSCEAAWAWLLGDFGYDFKCDVVITDDAVFVDGEVCVE